MNRALETLFTISLGSVGLFIFGQWIGGIQRITPDLLSIILLGMAGWHLKIGRGFMGAPNTEISVKTVMAFVGVCLLSMMTSPYAIFGQPSAYVQMGMMILVAGLFWATDFILSRRPKLLEHLIRFSVIVCGIVAWIGIGQFLTILTTGQYSPFEFSFMNDFAGGVVWYSASSAEEHRINSIMPEPALLGMLLSIPFGLVLIRLGLLGKALSARSRPLMPIWAAVGISSALLVCGSSLAYIEVIVVFVTIFIFGIRRINKTLLLKYLSISVVGFSVVAFVASKPILARVEPLVDQDIAAILANATLSALAANLYVTTVNVEDDPLFGAGIGAHQTTYKSLIGSDFFNGDERLADMSLNSDTAASLFMRLLSETGFIGLLSYGFVVWRIMFHSYKSIKGAVYNDMKAAEADTVILVSLFSASAATVSFCFIRLGNYYFPAMWIMLSILNCSSSILGGQNPAPLRPFNRQAGVPYGLAQARSSARSRL